MIINRLKHSPPLRVKVTQILNKNHKGECGRFISQLQQFNEKVIDHSISNTELFKRIRDSKRFCYGRNGNDTQLDNHYMSEDHFNNDYSLLSFQLRKELSQKELALVNNKECYIKEKRYRDNVILASDTTLASKLNQEEAHAKAEGEGEGKSNKDHKKTISFDIKLQSNKELYKKDIVLSRNKEYFNDFEEEVKKCISLDKKERMNYERTLRNRDVFLNQLHRNCHYQLNNISLPSEKTKLNVRSPCMITLKQFKNFSFNKQAEVSPAQIQLSQRHQLKDSNVLPKINSLYNHISNSRTNEVKLNNKLIKKCPTIDIPYQKSTCDIKTYQLDNKEDTIWLMKTTKIIEESFRKQYKTKK